MPGSPPIRDIVVPLVAIGLAGVVLVGAAALPPARFEPMGPAGLPYIIAAALLFLGLLDAGATVLRRRDAGVEQPASPGTRAALGRAFVGLLIIAAYLLVLEAEMVGFVTASVVFLIAMGAGLSADMRREGALLVLVAVVISIGTGLALARVFLVVLPGSGALF